jgi:hypothetical protein
LKVTNEQKIYLMRKTTLTRLDIGHLTPRQFITIYNEVRFQEAQEEYREAHNIALLLAAIANTVPRKGGKSYKAEDFLSGAAPSRNPQTKELDELAKEKGIKLPNRELKER